MKTLIYLLLVITTTFACVKYKIGRFI